MSSTILALNPFDSGSHRAFVDGWIRHSRHRFVTLRLPGRHWKWRMRHAPMALIDLIEQDQVPLTQIDALFSTDMLDLAMFRGLLPAASCLPTAIYFHENQLMYPQRSHDGAADRDQHFAFTNFVTASVADAVWFNSAWHRSAFLEALGRWLPRMPDFQPLEGIRRIDERSAVLYPGIDATEPGSHPSGGSAETIAWVSRWEHDKNPELFFESLREIRRRDIPFRLCLFGESFRRQPDCFDPARREFAELTDHWGYVDSHDEYLRRLRDCSIVVSTADHEFFGIGVLEAVGTGSLPVVPDRLAYPEVLQPERHCLHNGTANGIADAVSHLHALHPSERWRLREHSIARASAFYWSRTAPALDDAIEQLIANCRRQ